MKKTLREIINKDDGKHYQIGNHNLNAKEAVGYVFLIIAMLIYLIVSKAGFQHEWLGWLSLAIGLLSIYLGIKQNDV
ncbi:MAG: hypothetical protein GY834_10410 [Bacteroidetes bacterium]|nr:hypothetical protein [Bacteroidota bacterium]